jgi:hypothetical protein
MSRFNWYLWRIVPFPNHTAKIWFPEQMMLPVNVTREFRVILNHSPAGIGASLISFDLAIAIVIPDILHAHSIAWDSIKED